MHAIWYNSYNLGKKAWGNLVLEIKREMNRIKLYKAIDK